MVLQLYISIPLICLASTEKGRLMLPILTLSRVTISECRYRSEGGSLIQYDADRLYRKDSYFATQLKAIPL